MKAFRTIKLTLLLCLLAVIAACDRDSRTIHQEQILSLGTVVDISLYGVEEKKAHAAIAAVQQQLDAIHHHWHAWQPGRLTEINSKLRAGETVTLTPDEARFIQRGIDLTRQSNGLFDPGIGALVALWGFHSDERPETPPPTATAIQTLVQQHPSMAALNLDGNRLSSHNPATQLDFGGYAKGEGIDRAIAELRRRGITNAIVNAGGDLRAIGSKNGQPWRIGIRHPRAAGIIASVEIHGDESIYTSGDYERYFIHDGQRYHHILDPRNGMPVRGVAAVTVIHTDAATAEAADKALFVAGPTGFAAMAKRLGITQAMLIDTEGTVWLTPAMAKRLHFEINPAPRMRIVTQP